MGWLEQNLSWKNEQEYDAQFGDAPKGNLNTFISGPYGLGMYYVISWLTIANTN